jgi:hypothetical protein
VSASDEPTAEDYLALERAEMARLDAEYVGFYPDGQPARPVYRLSPEGEAEYQRYFPSTQGETP